MERIQQNKKLRLLFDILVILTISLTITLPLRLFQSIGTHDLFYHLDTIMALNDSWQTGTFGSKIYSLICQDYGYGTGIFYSMLPSGICVILMNIFNINVVTALSIELFLIFFLSGLTIYLFIKRVFKNNNISLFASCMYIIFPYFLIDVYSRFAFSETFLMLYIPLIVFSLFELINTKNYRIFFPLFVIGYSLAILTHLTLTLYITLFSCLYLILNFKKLKKDYAWFAFLLASFIVLLITATFYLPLIINYKIVSIQDMENSGLSIWQTTTNILKEPIFIFLIITCISVYIFYIIIRFKKEKEERIKDREIFILSTILLCMTLPIFPWYLSKSILNLIQFAWRILIIYGIFFCIQIAYIFKNTSNIKILKKFIYSISSVLIFILISIVLFLPTREIDLNNCVKSNSYISLNLGMGANKNGDYLPKNAKNEYIFTRLNSKLILKTNLDVQELANYQTQNNLSFICNESVSGYVILNIPYKLCNNVTIKQLSIRNQDKNLQASITEDEETKNIKINLTDSKYAFKVILEYEDKSTFKNYLIGNAFEFITLSGEIKSKNFEKKSATNYNVQFEVLTEGIVELPTLCYKGYTLTFTNTLGQTYLLNYEDSGNGFISVYLTESGKLTVNFQPKYVNVSNIISIIGVTLFLIIFCLSFLPNKFYKKISNNITNFFKSKTTISEIIRFLIVGGIATIIDILVMGLTLYLLQPQIYKSLFNVFFNSPIPSTFATILGTTLGFISGLLINYFLSIFIVFNNKSKAKNKKGFIIFFILSFIGLLINIFGTYIGFDLLSLNQWLVKIIMIIVVLVYNYISKRIILFNKTK